MLDRLEHKGVGPVHVVEHDALHAGRLAQSPERQRQLGRQDVVERRGRAERSGDLAQRRERLRAVRRAASDGEAIASAELVREPRLADPGRAHDERRAGRPHPLELRLATDERALPPSLERGRREWRLAAFARTPPRTFDERAADEAGPENGLARLDADRCPERGIDRRGG